MTSTILLIRHAAHSHVDTILSGRIAGLSLSGIGRSQAASLAHKLEGTRIDGLQTSPVQRARETADAIAGRKDQLDVAIEPALEELDFGEWSGRAFAELDDDPRWTTWNRARGAAVAPEGESMADAQGRAWAHVERTAAARPDQTIAMVSHCDIIRAVIARVLGLSLDYIQRFDVEPASISRIVVGPWGARVISVNERCGEQ